MSLAERIRQARERAGLTQDELAARIGVHQGTVSAWETGETQRLSGGTGKPVAEATGIALGWLRTDEGPMEAPKPPVNGETALTAFLATYPGDPLVIVRAALRDLERRGQPLPVWLAELYNKILSTLSDAEVKRLLDETERRGRNEGGDGDTGPDRRAG